MKTSSRLGMLGGIVAEGERFKHVPAIDGLRAIAVLAVIVYHVRPARLPGGFAGVDLFFVISGFVVTSSLRGWRFERARDLLGYFYARRALRIIPALAATLIVTAFLVVLFVPSARFMTTTQEVGLSAAGGVSNIYLSVVRNLYFGSRADLNAFLHTWTLGVEEQFYLFFPFLFFLWHRRNDVTKRNRGVIVVALVSLISLVICGLLARTDNVSAFFLMPSRFWELGTGMLLALTFDSWRPALATRSRWIALAGWTLSAAALGGAFLRPADARFPFPMALLPVAGAAGLIALVCARPRSLLTSALAHPIPARIGRISYSLYLWHWPTFVLFRWTVGLDGRLKATCAVLLSFAAAGLSYRFLERPVRRSRRIGALPRSWIIAAGIGTMAIAGGAILLFFHFDAQLTLSAGHVTRFYGETAPTGDCGVVEKSRPFAGGTVQSWTPDCGSKPVAQKLVIVGDSHARTYVPLAGRFAAEAKMPVYVYFRFGCGFPRVYAPASDRPDCAVFDRAVLQELKATLSGGDLLFMPALRIAVKGDARAGYAEALAQLRELSSTNARLVLEAPKPVFEGSIYRCMDWFNEANPECRPERFAVRRADMLARRAPVLLAMQRLEREVPGVEIWDPFPVLCPGDPCSVWRDGEPLYFDDDHISGHANALLMPSFRDFFLRPGRSSLESSGMTLLPQAPSHLTARLRSGRSP